MNAPPMLLLAGHEEIGALFTMVRLRATVRPAAPNCQPAEPVWPRTRS